MDVKIGSEQKQRAHARFDIRAAVTCTHEGHVFATESRNLSIGGMFLETDHVLPYGAALQIAFRIPTHEHEIKVAASVCWIERGVGFGVKFGALRAVEVWALNQLFAQLG